MVRVLIDSQEYTLEFEEFTQKSYGSSSSWKLCFRAVQEEKVKFMYEIYGDGLFLGEVNRESILQKLKTRQELEILEE